MYSIGSHSRLVKDPFNKNMYNLEILNRFGVWERVQWLHVSNAQNLCSDELPRVPEDDYENIKVW